MNTPPDGMVTVVAEVALPVSDAFIAPKWREEAERPD